MPKINKPCTDFGESGSPFEHVSENDLKQLKEFLHPKATRIANQHKKHQTLEVVRLWSSRKGC